MEAVHTPTATTRRFRRLLVANRGEIAVRIIRACKLLGIESVVAVSDADTESLAAKMADAKVLVGPGPAAESYLRIDRLVEAATRSNSDALHPGYGFLSERAAFARACAAAGIVFVGPSPETIESMGDKIMAVNLAESAGVPRVPGSGALNEVAQAARVANEIGYPVLIKATAGGGGRGMRVVRNEDELPGAMEAAAKEAKSAFGDDTLYMEKFIDEARHIEIQVMGDSFGNIVHLGERDCSTQRRHQKLIEESPSPVISDRMREEMCRCSVELAGAANYVGAGTVEYVVDLKADRFYFLEMNTRIQVEHPVTEMVTGLDLVVEQIRVAQGLSLSFTQDEVNWQGHAIECRINAEDANKNFLPKPGVIKTWEIPEGTGVRVDSHCYAGYCVPPFYDSLLAKLIVHGATRSDAIARMSNALKAFRVEGVPSTVPFHAEVMQEDAFVQSRITTRWVEQEFLPAQKAKQRAAADAARAAQPATPLS